MHSACLHWYFEKNLQKLAPPLSVNVPIKGVLRYYDLGGGGGGGGLFGSKMLEDWQKHKSSLDLKINKNLKSFRLDPDPVHIGGRIRFQFFRKPILDSVNLRSVWTIIATSWNPVNITGCTYSLKSCITAIGSTHSLKPGNATGSNHSLKSCNR